MNRVHVFHAFGSSFPSWSLRSSWPPLFIQKCRRRVESDAERSQSCRPQARDADRGPAVLAEWKKGAPHGRGRSVAGTHPDRARIHSGRHRPDFDASAATASLHCAPSLAAQWLTPRLASLFRAYPTLDVRLSANLRYADFPAAEFDADITYGQHASADCYSIPLGHETVTPMCAPQLAHRLQRPEDVLSERLIHSDNKRVRWVDWFHQNRIAVPETAGSRFDRSFIAIAAAVDGLGICLEIDPPCRARAPRRPSRKPTYQPVAIGQIPCALPRVSRILEEQGQREAFPRLAPA